MAVLIRHEKTSIGKAFEKAIDTLRNKEVKIGWFPSSRYKDEHNTPVASIAAQNEYGNPGKHIPARPFIRPAIEHNQKKWIMIGNRGVKAILAGNETVDVVLKAIGGTAVGDIQKSISLVYTPVLAKETIDRRLARKSHSGRLNKKQAESISKPLIDTGYMLATVSYEISSEI